MENVYDRLQIYTESNCLKLSSSKTHFMLLISAQRRQYYPLGTAMTYGQDLVEESEVKRCLGVNVSNNLCNWVWQINQVKKYIVSKCGAILNDLRKMTKYFSFKRRLNIGKSLFVSQMTYGIEL